jgi:hypothetical protein
MVRAILDLPEGTYSAIRAHLLPRGSSSEEAGFAFAEALDHRDDTVFRFLDWHPVPPEGFVRHSFDGIELTDVERARVIKRAHDLGASLVEFHSHPFQLPASFSLSDRVGFEEFVPHVWWRLRGRPYVAVVAGPEGFDALAWLDNPKEPKALFGIRAGRRLLRPTGLTLQRWSEWR